MNELEMFEFLKDYGIATTEEIGLAIALKGNSKQTYQDVLFIRTGYRNFEQFIEDEIEG